MASPEVLEFEKLLAPIPGDNPTGEDLRADSSPASPYYAIKDARNKARMAERQMLMAEDPGAVSPPDWRPVLQHAVKALEGKTKDLEIAAYLIEALARLEGFAGIRDGFRLARQLVDLFWDGLFPTPDEEGLTTRVAPLTGLNGEEAEGTLIGPINQIPLTADTEEGPMNHARYQEALATNLVTDPEARAKKIAKGALSMETFEKAVRATPGSFFVELVQDLEQTQEEFGKLTQGLEEKCGSLSPPSSTIRAALTGCLELIKNVAKDKLAMAQAQADNAGEGNGEAAGGAGGEGRPGTAGDAIRTREDAFRALLKVADYFRQSEPHTVVSYALEQVVRWGRMSLPELLTELIPTEAARASLFKQVGIKPGEGAAAEAGEKWE